MPFFPKKRTAQATSSRLALELRVMHPIALELDLPEHLGFLYPSIVLDYEPGDSITVGVPVRGAQEILVPPGTEVSFSTSQPDGVLMCHTSARERDGEGFLPALILAWPAGMKKINRRRGLRLGTQIPVDLTYSDDGDSVPRVMRGVTTDLSELGMRLVVAAPISDGTRLAVRLHLPGEPVRVCEGCVVRSGTSQPPGGGVISWIGVEFQNIDMTLQRSLRQYLWNLQSNGGQRRSR